MRTRSCGRFCARGANSLGGGARTKHAPFDLPQLLPDVNSELLGFNFKQPRATSALFGWPAQATTHWRGKCSRARMTCLDHPQCLPVYINKSSSFSLSLSRPLLYALRTKGLRDQKALKSKSRPFEIEPENMPLGGSIIEPDKHRLIRPRCWQCWCHSVFDCARCFALPVFR